MQQDFQRFRIRCHDDQIGDTTVQRLRRLVGALLQLLVVGCLLYQVQNGHSQLTVCQGISFGIDFGHLVQRMILCKGTLFVWIKFRSGFVEPHNKRSLANKNNELMRRLWESLQNNWEYRWPHHPKMNGWNSRRAKPKTSRCGDWPLAFACTRASRFDFVALFTTLDRSGHISRGVYQYQLVVGRAQ